MTIHGTFKKLVLWVVAFQLFFPFQLLAEGVGKFIDVRGDVALRRAAEEKKPVVSDPVFVKDLIRTKERSRAKLLLINNVQCSVASNSTMEISEFLLKDGKGSSALSVTSGAVHTKILKMLTPEARLEVRTPNAVAGARGTEWLTVVTPGGGDTLLKSDFYTFEEKISVVNPEFPSQAVTVNAGEYTEVKKGFPPTTPVAFSIAAIIGILSDLGLPAPGAGAAAGAAGQTAGVAAASGIGAGTVAGIAAGAAAIAAGVIAATGGGGGSGSAPVHASPSHLTR
jgi:hypothetical protein